MDLGIKGEIALVTGGSRGLGRQCSLSLAREGVNVAICARGKDAISNVVEEIKQYGVNGFGIVADMTSPDSIKSLFDTVSTKFGSISILINNASTFKMNNLHDTKVVDLNNDFFVNLIAPFILSREIFKGNLKGKIINLTDWKTIRKNRFTYGLSKFAVSGLTKSLAISMAPRFQINEIALGAILPPVDVPTRRSKKINLGPMKRVGRIDEITSCIKMFLDNDFITGEKINIDGGRHIL